MPETTTATFESGTTISKSKFQNHQQDANPCEILPFSLEALEPFEPLLVVPLEQLDDLYDAASFILLSSEVPDMRKYAS